MELPVALQGAQAALAFLLGAALGLLYDLIRAFRRRMRAAAAACADVVFCAAGAFALFAYALGPGEGQLRIFMLASVGLGAMVYGWLLAPSASPVFDSLADGWATLLRLLSVPLKKLLLKLKKVCEFEKNIFPKCGSWFTIITTYGHKAHHRGRANGERGEFHEVQKGRYAYEAPDPGSGALRHRQHRQHQQPQGRGRGPAGGTAGAGGQDDL